MSEKTIYQTLKEIDISKNVEKRKSGYTELSYLSWAFAWSKVKETYPTANYKVKEYDSKPYLFDENLGYLVSTEVTIDGETISMSLPVMDSSNKSMTNRAYEYNTKAGKRTVEKATMFDINKATMRCLVKNIAMFGLGITLYLGEDLPESVEIQKEAIEAEKAKKQEEAKKQILDQANLLLTKIEKNEEVNKEKTKKWYNAYRSYLPVDISEKIKMFLEKKEGVKIEEPALLEDKQPVTEV